MVDRYDTSNSLDGQYQPDSDNQVLKNKLGIRNVDEVNDLELDLLEQLYDAVLDEVEIDQSITVDDIFEWHRKWLGNVYEWAGKQRSVNLSKGDFHFAAATQIPNLLNILNREYLSRYTPSNEVDDDALSEAIAIVHVEFILIHPFREGNGRIARLLANVMALQAGKPEIDFSWWDENRDRYFTAIQHGLGGDYNPMKVFVKQALLDGDAENDVPGV